MAINFPTSPTTNVTTHTHNGVTYLWDGVSWVAQGSTSTYSLPTASSTVLGGIKVGNRLTINSGVLEADVQGGTYDDADVDTHLNQSNPTSGHVLSWNGSDYAWVAQSSAGTTYDLTASGGSVAEEEKILLTGSDSSEDAVTLAVDANSSLTIARANNKITFGGGGGGGATTLAALTDTTIPGTITTGHVLKWDGTTWGPAPDSTSTSGSGIALTDISVVKPNPTPSGNGDLTYNDVSGQFTFLPPNVPQNLSQLNNDVGFITGYTETDPTVPSHVKGITAQQVTNWDEAHGWGDHSTEGYLKGIGSLSIGALSDVDTTGVANNKILKHNGTSWVIADDNAGSGGTTINSLGDINDVSINNIQGDQLLKWDGNNWINFTSGYLTSFTETDPTVPAHVKSIGSADISNWNDAHGWGDHSIEGYLTTESDPTVPSHVKGITTGDINSWNAKSDVSALNDLSDVNTSGVGNGKILKHNGTSWVIGDDTTINTLNDIGDVNVGTTITDGYVLKWDNTNTQWVAAADLTGSATSSNTYVTYLNGEPRWSEQTAANNYQEAITYQSASTTGPGGVSLLPLCDGNDNTFVNMGCGHADMSYLWLSQAALTDVVKITVGFDGHGWIGYGSNTGISQDSATMLRVDNGQAYGANGVTGSPTEIIVYDSSSPAYSGQLQTLTFVEYPDVNGTGGSNRGPGSRCHVYYFKITRSVDNVLTEITYNAGALTDGDKGDITVSNSGSTWNIDASTVGTTELSATGTKDNTTFLRGDNTWATAGGAAYTIEALISPGIQLLDDGNAGASNRVFFDGLNGISLSRKTGTTNTIEFDGGSAGMATANVKSFGAKGDDSTDDTAAIQSAINSLVGSTVGKGGIVYLPPGIYRISSALTFGSTANAITLKGSSTHFPIMNTGGSIIRVTNTSGINAIEINNASSIAITNLGIDHASSSSGTAIKATSTTSKQGVTIDQVYILDHSKGIELNGYANSIIRNSEIRDQPDNANSTHAILLKKGSDARQDQLRMENVIVEGLVGGSTRHQYSKGLLVEDWTNSLWIKDCCFLRCKYGIYFDQSMGGETADAAAFHRIENCDVDQNDADGVFIDGGYAIWLQNCYLSSNINSGLVTGENFKGTMWINSPDCRGNNLYGMAFNVNHNKIQINSPHIADNGSAQPSVSAGIQVLDGANDISIMGGFIGGNVFGQHVNSGNQQIGIRFVGSTHSRININGVDVSNNISGGIEWMLAGQNVNSSAYNFIQNCAGYSTGQTSFP